MAESEEMYARFSADLEGAATRSELAAVQNRHLGRASRIKEEFRRLGELPEPQRRARASMLNDLARRMREEVDGRIEAAQAAESEQRLASEWLDMSLPGQAPRRGAWHPLTEVERRCLEVLRRLGFERADGPEVEDPYHNFDALNIPQHHPARDMQDTFWLDAGLLLRSHTTTIQARVLSARPRPPVKVAAAGRVYRNEAVDATHMAMFHQLEGFWLEPGLTMGHLKEILVYVARALYGRRVKLRFKPKYYPYTEPSVGLDIACTACGGEGCEACHRVGWVTIIGAGMIHPAVLREFGYDRDGVRGIAFGWGTTRMTAQWLGISKVRSLYAPNQRRLAYLHRGVA
ncbi:phenylalanine--tRNA ligase subunit alpha [Sphaerisporangium flaviroseum]|uniref:Phenylalanine--tRNA ligase alpha subunit n=1 Tax=Sphaerisporangium flaviroseum TaxID=509199 RepID=A0ABP7J8L2_9ACTN